MHNYRLIFLITVTLSFFYQNVLADGDIAAGKEKAQVCAACHGIDGNSSNPIWPKLAGQHEEYIVKQLMDFKAGNRENPQMAPMVANLSEQDIYDLAAYFSSQKPQWGKTDPAELELGQKIYRAGNMEAGVPACMACHGPTGRGNPAAKFPSLSGQHAEYTGAQLNAFRSKNRSNDINAVMRTIVGRMTHEEIKAVAQYIQGLHYREK